jgi:hypothetical protein
VTWVGLRGADGDTQPLSPKTGRVGLHSQDRSERGVRGNSSAVNMPLGKRVDLHRRSLPVPSWRVSPFVSGVDFDGHAGRVR